MNKKQLGLLGVLVLTASLTGSQAENWPHWRGPSYNGSSSESGLPTQFSKTENVQWAIDMRGPAESTPIVWEDRIFISTAHEASQRLLAVCYDRKTGEKLWENRVGIGISRDNRSTYAAPSPVTDGERVYFFYGNGALVAYDMQGNEVWSRNIQKDYGEFAFLWTFSSSPLLYNDTLYLQVLQRDVPVSGRGREDGPNKSYLLALDPDTGKEKWRHIRPSKARQESREAFSSPVPHTYEGRSEILIAGGDALTGHNPDTGEELWRWGTWNPRRITHWRLVPSPVAGDGVILACAPKGSPVYAIKAGGKGNLDDSAIQWKSEGRTVSSDVATPLYYQGHFYVLYGMQKTLSCVAPKTGEILWSHELDSRVKFQTSPMGADGKVYCINWDGKVFVFKAGKEPELLHTADMGGPDDSRVRSMVVPAQGQLFIRTDSKLYCVGQGKLAQR